MAEPRLQCPGLLTRLFCARRARERLAHLQDLQKPRVTNVPERRMIVVQLNGWPGKVAPRAFGALFSVFYALRPGTKPLPCARFPLGVLNLPGNQITGKYALPIPAHVEIPERVARGRGLAVVTEQWARETVAEVLHLGPYSEEPASIHVLERFLDEYGLHPTGTHEEEYHVGPGMLFRGNPARYLTFLRYPLRPEAVEQRAGQPGTTLLSDSRLARADEETRLCPESFGSAGQVP